MNVWHRTSSGLIFFAGNRPCEHSIQWWGYVAQTNGCDISARKSRQIDRNGKKQYRISLDYLFRAEKRRYSHSIQRTRRISCRNYRRRLYLRTRRKSSSQKVCRLAKHRDIEKIHVSETAILHRFNRNMLQYYEIRRRVGNTDWRQNGLIGQNST